VTAALPPVPELDPTLLETYHAAHARLDRAIADAGPGVGRLLTRFANRTMVAAVANVRPSSRGRASPALFPAPRSFLAEVERRRLAGSDVAYRHVDSRLAVVREGIDDPPALLPETPYVLHALVEGPVLNPDEMNPGMIRAVELIGDLPVASYAPPTRASCRALLTEAVGTVTAGGSGAPAAARAAWMLHVLGEIHPFGDGNGRVARLLYLLIAGEELPRTVDWGVVEQLRFHQDTWSDTLKERDPTACVVATTELSIAGAELMEERLAALGALRDELCDRSGLAVPAAVLVLAAWIRRGGRLDDLASDLGITYREALEQAEALRTEGLLARCADRSLELPARTSYRVAGPAAVLTGRASGGPDHR